MVELGVAVLGAGFIGGVHARSARLAGARLVCTMASSPERSAAAAEELGAERPLTSLEDLAAADDVDVVHVCTPNALHAEQVRTVLGSGKHVICEKPLAINREDATSLAAFAHATGLVATVPFAYRFYPTVRQARMLVSQGRAGDLHLLHGAYLQDWMSSVDDWSWRVDAELGGPSRALADIGSHWFDLVEFVSGHRVTRMQARLHTAISERVAHEHRSAFTRAGDDDREGRRRAVTTEDAGMVLFETDRGAVGSVVVSQVSPGRKNLLQFELDGSDAAIAFDQERPDELWIGARSGNRIYTRGDEDSDADASRLNLLPAGHPQGYHDAFALFVADTYAAILGERPPGLPTFDDGLRAVTLIDTALRSSHSGSWVAVGDMDYEEGHDTDARHGSTM